MSDSRANWAGQAAVRAPLDAHRQGFDWSQIRKPESGGDGHR